MALSVKALTGVVRVAGTKPGVLFSRSTLPATFKASVATIVSKSSRTEPVDKPKPWDYENYGYNTFTAYYERTKKRLDENSKVIVVEGMPCIGKSNLARALAEELEMKYYPMITGEHYYINQYGYDLRDANKYLPAHLRSFDDNDFLKNPKHERAILLHFIRHLFQYWEYMVALSHLLNTGQGVVLDRCVYSEPVWTDALHDMGYLTKAGKRAMEKHREIMFGRLMRPHLIVYLDAPVSVVESNLKKRGRGEEKVYTREMLEKLEYNYKFNFLKTITEHAELVAYDWSVPGDADVIVEDIERIDFDRFDIHDPKMEDWRIGPDWDWCDKRWWYTNQTDWLLEEVMQEACFDVPGMFIQGEDHDLWEWAMNKVPGNQYVPGYHWELGDKRSLFNLVQPTHKFRDFDLDPVKPKSESK